MTAAFDRPEGPDGISSPSTAIILRAGASRAAIKWLENRPSVSGAWLVENGGDKAIADLREAAAPWFEKATIVTLSPDQARRRCPFRRIDIVLIDAAGLTGDEAAEFRREQVDAWRAPLEASGDGWDAASRVFLLEADGTVLL